MASSILGGPIASLVAGWIAGRGGGEGVAGGVISAVVMLGVTTLFCCDRRRSVS